MKIQYASDLHLDLYDYELHKPNDVFARLIVPVGDVLLLAGDIGSVRLLRAFFAYVSRLLQRVFFVCGCSEYYRSSHVPCVGSTADCSAVRPRSIEAMNEAIAALCQKFDNVHFLNNDAMECGDVVFIGSTLWSHILPSQTAMVANVMEEYACVESSQGVGLLDAERPRSGSITPSDTMRLFRRNIAWLKFVLAKYSQRRVVLLTHHAPSLCLLGEEHASAFGVDVSCAYASPLEPFLSRYRNIEAWVCGRVHRSAAYLIFKIK